MEKVVRVGVGVYIFNNKNQLLLGLRIGSHDAYSWCPPGGHMEFGETVEQTAIREVKEENNLDVLPEDIKLEGVTNDFYKEMDKHYITLHVFCKKYQGNERIMEPNKCIKWQWFNTDNLPENLMLPVRNFLQKYKLL